MSKLAQNFALMKRELFVKAALTEDGESRVPQEAILLGIAQQIKAAQKDVKLRSFTSGSIGIQVPMKLTLTNDEGDEFEVKGNLLLTIPETRPIKSDDEEKKDGESK